MRRCAKASSGSGGAAATGPLAPGPAHDLEGEPTSCAQTRDPEHAPQMLKFTLVEGGSLFDRRWAGVDCPRASLARVGSLPPCTQGAFSCSCVSGLPSGGLSSSRRRLSSSSSSSPPCSRSRTGPPQLLLASWLPNAPKSEKLCGSAPPAGGGPTTPRRGGELAWGCASPSSAGPATSCPPGSSAGIVPTGGFRSSPPSQLPSGLGRFGTGRGTPSTSVPSFKIGSKAPPLESPSLRGTVALTSVKRCVEASLDSRSRLAAASPRIKQISGSDSWFSLSTVGS